MEFRKSTTLFEYDFCDQNILDYKRVCNKVSIASEGHYMETKGKGSIWFETFNDPNR